MAAGELTPYLAGLTTFKQVLKIGTVHSFAEISEQIIMLADHTKFGLTFALQMLPNDQIDTIITSNQTSDETLNLFEAQGIEIKVAEIVPLSSL